MITLTNLLQDISAGKLDTDLSAIGRAITFRRESLGSATRGTLSIGSSVWFTGAVRPTYLIGAEAKVTGFKTKRIVVNLVNPIGRFQRGIRTDVSFITTAKP